MNMTVCDVIIRGMVKPYPIFALTVYIAARYPVIRRVFKSDAGPVIIIGVAIYDLISRGFLDKYTTASNIHILESVAVHYSIIGRRIEMDAIFTVAVNVTACQIIVR